MLIGISCQNQVTNLPHFFFLTSLLSHWDFSHGKLGCFPQGKPAVSHTTQPTVHAGCYSVSIIHRTLTWTKGPLMCAQILMNAIAHAGVWTRKMSLHWKLTPGEKSFATPGNRTCVSGVPVPHSTNWATFLSPVDVALFYHCYYTMFSHATGVCTIVLTLSVLTVQTLHTALGWPSSHSALTQTGYPSSQPRSALTQTGYPCSQSSSMWCLCFNSFRPVTGFFPITPSVTTRSIPEFYG